jgi:hypothetical protein
MFHAAYIPEEKCFPRRREWMARLIGDRQWQSSGDLTPDAGELRINISNDSASSEGNIKLGMLKSAVRLGFGNYSPNQVLVLSW